MTRIADDVVGVTVRIRDGKTLEFDGLGGTVRRESSPTAKGQVPIKTWTDGTEPRVTYVTVSLVERDDS